MNKVVLKLELDFDFVLIAISSPLKDYRMCYFINKFTTIELTKADDYCLNIYPNNVSSSFSCYEYYSEQGLEFHLLANKGEENRYLIPEMKTSDYFLIIKNFIDEEDLNDLINGINSIPDVVVATEISADKLKSRENLIF